VAELLMRDAITSANVTTGCIDAGSCLRTKVLLPLEEAGPYVVLAQHRKARLSSLPW
jgi:hypothetical protein